MTATATGRSRTPEVARVASALPAGIDLASSKAPIPDLGAQRRLLAGSTASASTWVISRRAVDPEAPFEQRQPLRSSGDLDLATGAASTARRDFFARRRRRPRSGAGPARLGAGQELGRSPGHLERPGAWSLGRRGKPTTRSASKYDRAPAPTRPARFRSGAARNLRRTACASRQSATPAQSVFIQRATRLRCGLRRSGPQQNSVIDRGSFKYGAPARRRLSTAFPARPVPMLAAGGVCLPFSYGGVNQAAPSASAWPAVVARFNASGSAEGACRPRRWRLRPPSPRPPVHGPYRGRHGQGHRTGPSPPTRCCGRGNGPGSPAPACWR